YFLIVSFVEEITLASLSKETFNEPSKYFIIMFDDLESKFPILFAKLILNDSLNKSSVKFPSRSVGKLLVMYILKESEPYAVTKSTGLITLPIDFDILVSLFKIHP